MTAPTGYSVGPFSEGGYQIDVLVTGFPGKSVCHGYLGWSSIVHIGGRGVVALVDTGGIGVRPVLLERLAQCQTSPAHVTDLLLTHMHHDHAINWTLFSKSRIVISEAELDWALGQPWGETQVPELYARELKSWPTLYTPSDGEEVLSGIFAYLAPGHTPGCMIYVLRGEKRDVIFTGDAAKNRAELVSGVADMTSDADVSTATIHMIWDRWRERPNTILVPGHDLPMVQDSGIIRYVGEREAAVTAWHGDDLQTRTLFRLEPVQKKVE